MESKSYSGTVVGKIEKSTYNQLKVDIGNEKTVTLNTKDSTLYGSTKVGDQGTWAYNESPIPGKLDDNGKPIVMKWIRNPGETQPPRREDDLDMTQLDKILLSLTELHIKFNTLLATLQSVEPVNVAKPTIPNNQEVEIEKIPF